MAEHSSRRTLHWIACSHDIPSTVAIAIDIRRIVARLNLYRRVRVVALARVRDHAVAGARLSGPGGEEGAAAVLHQRAGDAAARGVRGAVDAEDVVDEMRVRDLVAVHALHDVVRAASGVDGRGGLVGLRGDEYFKKMW